MGVEKDELSKAVKGRQYTGYLKERGYIGGSIEDQDSTEVIKQGGSLDKVGHKGRWVIRQGGT